MARYFFRSVDGGIVPDDEGTECSSTAAARVEAIRYAGDVMKNEPDVLRDGDEFRVEVANGFGERLFTVVCYAIDEAELSPDARS